MKACICSLALCGWIILTDAQPTNSFPLWPGDVPGALGKAPADIPTLTPFFPSQETATGAAIISCPGGGYAHLAPHEGGSGKSFSVNLFRI